MTKYILGLLIVCFMSCEEAKPEIEILQNEEKVVNIMTDMYIAESALNKQSIVVRDSLTRVYRDNIILIHDLSDEEFDTLFWIIQTDIESYEEIHKQVLSKLKDMSSSVDNK